MIESAYEQCLCRERSLRSLNFETQRPHSIKYKDVSLDCGYRLDIDVDDTVLLEITSVKKALPIHEAQLLNYLKATGIRVGLLINFGPEKCKYRRFVC